MRSVVPLVLFLALAPLGGSRDIPTVRVRGFGHPAYWFLGGHVLAAWSNGYGAELAGGATPDDRRAKLAMAAVLRRL